MSTESQNTHVDLEPLVATCRQLSRLLGAVKPSAALRIAAPGLAEGLPLVKALVLGVEDLVDRVALIEARQRAPGELPDLELQVLTGTHPSADKRL